MEVILKQDVDHLGLRGEVVNVARGYARNFLLPRGLAQVATPALVRELEKRDTQRARHEAKSVDEARAIAGRIEKLELRFDVERRPDRRAVRLRDRDERRRPPLGRGEDPRRPAQAGDGDDQADRPLPRQGRPLHRRRRRAEARGRAGGRGAAARGGARRARGARARRGGGRRGRSRRRAPGRRGRGAGGDRRRRGGGGRRSRGCRVRGCRGCGHRARGCRARGCRGRGTSRGCEA